MINLLPPEEKEKLFSKKKEKLATILVIIFSVFLVCLILILLSVKFYILAETDYQKNILNQTKQRIQTSEFVNLNNVIKKYNGILTQLDSFYKKEVYFSKALENINNIPSPDGLYLTNFSLKREDSGKVTASVSGTSSIRENLLIFKKNIEQNQAIKNPYFSSESWTSPQNVNFSLTFETST